MIKEMLESDDEEMVELAITLLKNDASPYLDEFNLSVIREGAHTFVRENSLFPLKFRTNTYYGNWMVHVSIISITVKKMDS